MLSNSGNILFLIFISVAFVTGSKTVADVEPRSVQSQSRTLPVLLLALPLLVPILFLLALLIFFPVPVVTIPGRAETGSRFLQKSDKESVIYNSEACVERLTCELVAKDAHGLGTDLQKNWIYRFLDKFSSRVLMTRITEASKSKECDRYICPSYSSLLKAFQDQHH